MDNKEEKVTEVCLSCDCGCETMVIKKVVWGAPFNDTDYYVDFRVDAFYAGQRIFGILKRRIKFAWEALLKGNYIHQEIVTNELSLKQLRDELNKMFSDETHE